MKKKITKKKNYSGTKKPRRGTSTDKNRKEFVENKKWIGGLPWWRSG